ncbi:GNAT family N-acetyltransferase [Limibaculum sp. FT325]|uniref:GNAT family N-acetyltransferase n=1 Tax=Thermohalobaculum sediminis TaxID=2939436 RepID=UPI0020BEED6B|nr:GNAT family N-acetyltransferase [Limibaculum sediminis]MCL5777923.1 GNAT family N-acetyltransferase [Limibaculum sediminis]
MNRPETHPPDGETRIEIEVVRGIAAIGAADWDACAAPGRAAGARAVNPFVTHAFLAALESSGSATPATGWAPHHLVARVAGRVEAVMPLYLKGHSQGEYVFDHAWANAWHRAGREYYPKLQSAVPFTPATGPRTMARPDARPGAEAMQAALMGTARDLTAGNDLSSLHITFCTEAEWELGGRLGLLQRTDQQFHWINRGYRDFADFLDALASRKRKQIRRERAGALADGVRLHHLTGAAIRPEHWDAFWLFYQDTGSRKWGSPYLTRSFFDIVHQTMADDILLVMAEREGRWIAGALNFIGAETLYGRYWGCREDRPFLHFECCYHQAINFALEHGLARVEAGAQGAHKLARGYEPVTTRSLHWIPDPGFRAAVARYLEQERAAVAAEGAELAGFTPFRRGG